MRRARIKAVATVPVRRKAAQDTASVESASQADAKVPEKPSEVKAELNDLELTPAPVEQKEDENVIAPRTPEKIPVSPVKDEECSQPKVPKVQVSSDNIKESEPKDEQPATKIESPQKPPTPSIEGSPIKTIQSRSCFMRPTPRLDGGGRIRRNSIQGSGASASESEDDSRRSNSVAPNRVRNDSICSVQSLKDSGNTSNIAKLNLGQKRRMIVSESARKLAEARREFLLKHENKSPDKSKLTMYDLIYYNPTTNPMKPKPVTGRSNIRKISVCSIPDKKKVEEESVDEPAEMLVPQVKVGPNGQLIIDEQSLVIDQYKAQENIDRSDIIVDEDTTGNGFYKRRQKSKDWNKWETVKFYKALNTYGTDFLLMQSVFPKRTRQELKLKYKKEERLNHNLIEKALQYQEFDTEALEKDLASVEENERKESELNKVRKETNSSSKKKLKRARCYTVSEEVNCDAREQNVESNKNSCNEQSSDENARITITKKVRKRPTRKRNVTKVKRNSGDESVKDNSDSEPEVYKAKPTRSGRAPRKIKKTQKPIKVFDVANNDEAEQTVQAADTRANNEEESNKEIDVNDLQCYENTEGSNDLDKTKSAEASSQVIDKKVNQTVQIQNDVETENQSEFLEILGAGPNTSSNAFEGITDDLPNMANLKPGSLVVLKKDCTDEPGKTILQVYIVSADYDVNNPNCKDSLLPIDLSPDILETVTNCIKNIEPQNIP